MKNELGQVLIESEGRTVRWGEATFLKSWNGLKLTMNARALKTFVFPLALGIFLTAFLFKNNGQPSASPGKPIRAEAPSPVAIPILSSRVLVERDLERARPRTIVTAPRTAGGIEVFSLKPKIGMPAGSEAKAVLESGATNGIVKARLLAPIMVDGEPLYPERSVLVGKGSSTEERLFIEFTKLVLQSGETVRIRAQAFDGKDQILGLKGSLVGGKGRKMLWGAGLGFVGGMATGLQAPTSGSMFYPERRPTVEDAALAGASKAALDQSQIMFDEVKNAPVIVEVKKGTEFFIIADDPEPSKEKQ